MGDRYGLSTVRVIDCFTFFNEIHLLSLRLETLKNVVDVFIIAEMDVTHAGLKKGFVLDAYLDKLSVPRSRIVHVKIQDAPSVDPRVESERWILEHFQRNALARGIGQLALAADDMVLISDLDEIPDPSALSFAAGALASHETVVFCQMHRKFFFNALAGDYQTGQGWLGTIAVHAGSVARSCPQDLRRGAGFPRAAYIWTQGRVPSTCYVEPGGWHLTYFGGANSVSVKMHSIVEGNRAANADMFAIPPKSRHNWRDGRTPEVLSWIKQIDAFIYKVDKNMAGLRYLPQPLRADPMRWEWLWWFDEVLEISSPGGAS